jgi:hypothetical protein
MQRVAALFPSISRFINCDFLVIAALTLVFSFFSSGFLFCLVNHVPLFGYSMTESNQLTVSYIDLNTYTGQFTFEAWVMAFVSAAVVGGAFALHALLAAPARGRCATLSLCLLALLAPAGLYCACLLFRVKHSAYAPGFAPAWATRPRVHGP